MYSSKFTARCFRPTVAIAVDYEVRQMWEARYHTQYRYQTKASEGTDLLCSRIATRDIPLQYQDLQND